MDIIKRGKEGPNTFRGKCDGCGSILEAMRDEILQLDYDSDLKIEFGTDKCPLCGEPFTLHVKGSKEDKT